MVHELNKCLDKEASIPLKSTRSEIIDAARSHDNYNRVFDCVENFIKNDAPASEPTPEPTKYQELSSKELQPRIEASPYSDLITKTIFIYMKCIITLSEYQKILLPVHSSDPRLYHHLSQLGEDVQVRRRKVTVFAPLN